MKGTHGGVAVNPDGSNINPAALALLNLNKPDGNFLIPTPQTVDPSKQFFSQGFSVFSDACHFDENQFSSNLDYIVAQRLGWPLASSSLTIIRQSHFPAMG